MLGLFGMILGDVWAHPADEQVTIVDVFFEADGSWRAEIYLDVESILMRLNEGDIDEFEYEALMEMYRDETISVDVLRPRYQKFVMGRSGFLFDDDLFETEMTFGKDPEFDYESSLGESFWGRIMVAGGELPEGSKSFRFLYPKIFHPVVVNISHHQMRVPLTDFITRESKRETEAFYFEQAKVIEGRRLAKERQMRGRVVRTAKERKLGNEEKNPASLKREAGLIEWFVTMVLFVGGVGVIGYFGRSR